MRRHVCREKKKRAETGSSGLARKSTSEVSCPFPSEMGYHNPIFENSVLSNYQNLLINGFITRKIKSKVSNTLFYNCLFFSDTYDNNYR